MVQDYKPKRIKRYASVGLLNAVREVKEGTLTLGKADEKYEVPLGTLSNHVKGESKAYSQAGHPTAFSKETELLMAKHIACLGEWGYPFDLLDIRMFAKQILCEEGKTVPQFNDNLPSKE